METVTRLNCADLLKRHAEELADKEQLRTRYADLWVKSQSDLDALRHRHAEELEHARQRMSAKNEEIDNLSYNYRKLEDRESALRQRAESAEERENRLDRLAEAQDGALAAVTEKISALTKERDEAIARAEAAESANRAEFEGHKLTISDHRKEIAALKKERDEATARVNATEEALDKYGQHTSRCDKRRGMIIHTPCTCGFDTTHEAILIASDMHRTIGPDGLPRPPRNRKG